MSYKSSKGRDLGKEITTWQSSNIGQGIGGGASGPVTPAASASGGNVDGLEPGNGYTYQTFTSPGTLTVTGASIRADIFVLGGGGGGSRWAGGGAGGLAYIGSRVLEIDTYPVTIGSGGGGGASSGNSRGGSGGDTTFGPGTPTPITANGGGGGAGNSGGPIDDGGPGGCGGGGSDTGRHGGDSTQYSENGPLKPQGLFNFGSFGCPGLTSPGNSPGAAGGGGGGIGGQGYSNEMPSANGPSSPDGGPARTEQLGKIRGKGGNALQFNGFDGTTIGVSPLAPLEGHFGGGGGSYFNPQPGGGYSGGGGAGGTGGPVPSWTIGNTSVNAFTNSGSGGGGNGPSSTGGTGGSGICIIRWKINYEPS